MAESLGVSVGNSTTGRSQSLPRSLPPPPGAAWIGAAVRGVARVVPRWGARAAARLFLTTRRSRLPAREQDWLATAARFEIVTPQAKLAAWSWGEGEPVLLVHGWDGRGAQLGAVALDLAQRGLRPIAVDLPAHGETVGSRTNLLELAAAIRGAVDRLGGVRAVVAHSFGAAACTVALREPLPLDRLVYLAPSEDFDHFIAVFGSWLALPQPLLVAMQSLLEVRFGTPWHELRARTLAPGMRRPLLIVHDEEDCDVPLSHGETYAERWPGARLVTTQGLGHRRILRDPTVVAQVGDFLSSP